MFALIYLALTAKPFSLRHLFILFVFAQVSAKLVLVAFHSKHAPYEAVTIAGATTLFMWSIPLARLVYNAICFRKVAPEVLSPVSGFIRWTYGVALAFVPILTIGIMIHPGHEVRLGGLARLVVAAIFVGTLLQISFDWKGRHGSGNRRTRWQKCRNLDGATCDNLDRWRCLRCAVRVNSLSYFSPCSTGSIARPPARLTAVRAHKSPK